MGIRRLNTKQIGHSLDTEHIFTGSDNGEVYVWNFDSGRRVQVLKHGPSAPLLSYSIRPADRES
jgi:hypothetical protein